MKYTYSSGNLGYHCIQHQLNKTQGEFYQPKEKDGKPFQNTFQICQKAPYIGKPKKHPQAKQIQERFTAPIFQQNCLKNHQDFNLNQEKAQKKRLKPFQQVQNRRNPQKQLNQYRQIIRILEEQNKNLKQQNQYLLKNIAKQRQKTSNEIIYLQQQTIQLQSQIQEYKRLFYPKNNHQIDEGVKMEETKDRNRVTVKINDTVSQTMESKDELQKLNLQFQNYFEEYRKTKEVKLRQTCVSVAKKIKLMKESKTIEQPKRERFHKRNHTADLCYNR